MRSQALGRICAGGARRLVPLPRPLKAVFPIVVAVSLAISTHAQSLADVAKKAEEERAKLKQGQATRVFTNKDLPDAPPARAAAPVETKTEPSAKDTSNKTTTEKPNEEKRDDDHTLEPRASDRQGGPPSDGQIRVSRVSSVGGNAVETTLTLILHGPQNDLPVNLVFRAVHEDRLPDRPGELGVSFVMSPLFGGALDLKPPHVVLIVDEGSASADILTANVDERQPISNFGSVDVPFDFVKLSRFERATKVRGRLFNMEFALTPEQVRSIGEFARRTRQRPR